MVVVAIIGGFALSGSPATERSRRFDQQRINDLQMISTSIDQSINNSTSDGRLPLTIEELRNQRDIYIGSTIDPKTKKPYEYRPLTTETYELCASFEMAMTQEQNSNPELMYPNPKMGSNFWDHEAGRKCYTVTVNRFTK